MGLHQVVYTGYYTIFLFLLTGSTMRGDYANERKCERNKKYTHVQVRFLWRQG